MKLLIAILWLAISAAAQADAFDSEWARFEKDFESLNSRPYKANKSKSLKKLGIESTNGDTVAVEERPEKRANITDATTNLNEEDKLGYQVTDPKVREKILALYKKANVVVQQYVIPFN